MGVDLTLHPDKYGGESNWWLATTSLPLRCDYQLWEAIKEVDSDRLPPAVKFTRYADEGCEDTTKDAYGTSLRYCLAGDLAAMTLRGDVATWNAAIFAMLRVMEPSTPVVLYWH